MKKLALIILLALFAVPAAAQGIQKPVVLTVVGGVALQDSLNVKKDKADSTGLTGYVTHAALRDSLNHRKGSADSTGITGYVTGAQLAKDSTDRNNKINALSGTTAFRDSSGIWVPVTAGKPLSMTLLTITRNILAGDGADPTYYQYSWVNDPTFGWYRSASHIVRYHTVDMDFFGINAAGVSGTNLFTLNGASTTDVRLGWGTTVVSQDVYFHRSTTSTAQLVGNFDLTGTVAGTTVFRDTSAFVTTETRHAIYIAGATMTNQYEISARHQTDFLPVADDLLAYQPKTDSLIVVRAAGTTSGLQFSFIRIK